MLLKKNQEIAHELYCSPKTSWNSLVIILEGHVPMALPVPFSTHSWDCLISYWAIPVLKWCFLSSHDTSLVLCLIFGLPAMRMTQSGIKICPAPTGQVWCSTHATSSLCYWGLFSVAILFFIVVLTRAPGYRQLPHNVCLALLETHTGFISIIFIDFMK